jgi:hypothetical protein
LTYPVCFHQGENGIVLIVNYFFLSYKKNFSYGEGMLIKVIITPRFFLLLCLGLVFTVQPGQKVSAENPGIFLPTILNSYKPPSNSPFWIEIAQLHMITPPGSAAPSPMSEAKWRAYLAEVFPTLVNALAESGAGGTRIFIKWADIEPTAPNPGQPPNYDTNWWTWYEDRIHEIAQTGLKIIGTVAIAPSWASASPCPPIDSDHLDEYARFLTDLVNHYKVPPYNIHYWELDNEPDNVYTTGNIHGFGCWGNNGAEYATMAAAGYAAIKAADPEAYVLMGGIAYDWFTEYGGPFNRYFPDDVMTNNGALNFDALNIHYFPDYYKEWERWTVGNKPTCPPVDGQPIKTHDVVGVDIIAKASYFRNRMSTCFNVNNPLWVTELAEHGYSDKPDWLDRQARYVIQGNVRSLAAGAIKIVWFAMITPNDPSDQGLLYADLSPKRAFTAFKTLSKELMDYQYLAPIDSMDVVGNVEGYVFSAPAQANKTVVWGSVTGGDRMNFHPASQLRIVDRYGNVGTVYDGSAADQDHSVNGSIQLQITIEPVFIQIIR